MQAKDKAESCKLNAEVLPLRLAALFTTNRFRKDFLPRIARIARIRKDGFPLRAIRAIRG
jgi:hypothetical protein